MAISKQKQKSWWHNWVQVWSPENQKFWCPRAGRDGCPSSESEDGLTFLHFGFYSGLQETGKHVLMLVRGHSLLHLPEPNASLCQKHPQEYTWKQCLATHLASLSPGELTSKTNCHARTVIPPALFFYLKTLLTIQCLFFFQLFKIINPSSVRNAIGFLMNNFIYLHMFLFKIIFLQSITNLQCTFSFSCTANQLFTYICTLFF